MLRKRLVIVLTFNNGVLFRTRNFIPDYRYTLNFVDAWSVDEIVVLDITRPGEGDPENFRKIVELLAENCFVPLAAGGGVRTLEDMKQLLDIGADKIILNTAVKDNVSLVTEAANRFGSQCVVVSVDAKKQKDGDYEVFCGFGKENTGSDPATWAKRGEEAGAGEILITSIDKDGTLEGYDNELNRQVCEAVDIPVLVSGGAGKWQDFVDGFEMGKASAVCTSNIYHFTESSIKSAKQFLDKAGIPVRV